MRGGFRPGPRMIGDQSSCSVATSFQFGSRDLMLRAKVHSSLIVTTWSPLPSTKRSGSVAGGRDHLGLVADGDLGCLLVEIDIGDIDAGQADEGEFNTVFPAASRSEIAWSNPSNTSLSSRDFERLAVAGGESRDNHLVSRLGAFEEAFRHEGRIGAADRLEICGDLGIATGILLGFRFELAQAPCRRSAFASRPAPDAAPRRFRFPAQSASVSVRRGPARGTGGRSLPVRLPRTERMRKNTTMITPMAISVGISRKSDIRRLNLV